MTRYRVALMVPAIIEEVDADTPEEARKLGMGEMADMLELYEDGDPVTIQVGQVVETCQACGTEVSDGSDIDTISDHGVCFNCQRQIVNGERCAICWKEGHSSYQHGPEEDR